MNNGPGSLLSSALKTILTCPGRMYEAHPVAGFSGDQQFFISFAQSWRTKIREPAARQRLVTDGHAPAEYRADTVRNEDPWYEAFSVKLGQKLWLAPSDRVRVW